MEVFKHLKDRRQQKLEKKISDQAGRISVQLTSADSGYHTYDIGRPPLLDYNPEQYVRDIDSAVHQKLGDLSSQGLIKLDIWHTHRACAEDDVIHMDRFPQNTKSTLSVVYSRL